MSSTHNDMESSHRGRETIPRENLHAKVSHLNHDSYNVTKLDFTYCGIAYVTQGSERERLYFSALCNNFVTCDSEFATMPSYVFEKLHGFFIKIR